MSMCIRVRLVFFISLIAFKFTNAQQKSIDSTLIVLKKESGYIYNILSKINDRCCLGDTVVQLIFAIRYTIDSIKKECAARELFCNRLSHYSKRDSTIFTEYKNTGVVPLGYDEIDNYLSIISRMLAINTIRSIDSLESQTNEIKNLVTLLSTPQNSRVKQRLTAKQQSFADKIIDGLVKVYNDWYSVVRLFNPSLVTKEQLEKYQLQYTKPIQQAYLRRIAATVR